MNEIINRYEDVLTRKPKKKSSFGLLNNLIDTFTGDFSIFTNDIPKQRKTILLETHNLDLRTNTKLIVDNDRVGNNDSSMLVTEEFISIHSDKDIFGGIKLELKIPLKRIKKIENKLDTVFITTLEKDDKNKNVEFNFPINLIIQSDIEINIPKIESLFNLLNEIIDNIKVKEDLDKIYTKEELIDYEKECNYPSYKPFIKFADNLIKKGDLEEARKMINKAWQYLNKQIGEESFLGTDYPLYHYILNSNINIEIVESKYYHGLGDSYTGLCRLEEVSKKFEDFNSEVLNEAILLHKKKFKKDFLSFPIEKRKVIIITEEFPTKKPKTYIQLNQETLPTRDIFPHMNPRNGEVYIAHPYKPIYFERDNFEEKLTSERLNEFFRILRCLGAEEISYESNSSFFNEELTSSSKTIGAEASTPKVRVSQKIEVSSNEHTSVKTDNRASYIIEYEPTKKPYLPSDLFWYKHESDWQRIVDDRLNGNNILAKSKIVSDVFTALSSSESFNLESEISLNKLPIGGSKRFNKNSSKNKKGEASISVVVKIKFKHKEELV